MSGKLIKQEPLLNIDLSMSTIPQDTTAEKLNELASCINGVADLLGCDSHSLGMSAILSQLDVSKDLMCSIAGGLSEDSLTDQHLMKELEAISEVLDCSKAGIADLFTRKTASLVIQDPRQVQGQSQGQEHSGPGAGAGAGVPDRYRRYPSADSSSYSPSDSQDVHEPPGAAGEQLLEPLRRSVSGGAGLSSVAGLDEAKKLLMEAVVLPLRYKHLFTGARKPWSSVLLYGPPGTGKTRLALAVAAEIGAEFYVVTPADLLSRWFGKTEQNIRNVFRLLKERARTRSCIVFLDEVDGLCRLRTNDEAECSRRMKTELLNHLQESGSGDPNPTSAGAGPGADGQLFFLCATNCPWEIDPAFLRRFQRRIFISLPDRCGRLAIIRGLSVGSGLELSDAEWGHLLDQTEGFSGSDLANLVKSALYQPVRELTSATYWTPIPSSGMWMPSSHDVLGAVNSDFQSFPPELVCPRNVTVSDFLSVISDTRPTVRPEDLTRYESFTNQFGQLG